MSFFWNTFKKERRRTPRTRTVFPMGRFSRITMQVLSRKGEDISEGVGFLHDLSPDGISLFVERKFEANETIEILLPVPKPLRLEGRVAWCKQVPSFRLLKKKRFPYRIGLQFEFGSSENRQALELVCANLAVRRFTEEMT